MAVSGTARKRREAPSSARPALFPALVQCRKKSGAGVHRSHGCSPIAPSWEISSHCIPLRRSGGRLGSMYVEPGPLRDSDLKVSQGDLVHDLSPANVKEAFRLAKHGCQQLRTILEPGKTIFKFTVSFDDHTMQTVIRISTVHCQESGRSSSYVAGGYWPCCHQVLDEKIRLGIEVVYNVYVRANRQTFDNAWCGIHYRYFYFKGANGDSLTSFPSRANPPSCKGHHIPPIAQLTGDRCCQSTCEGESLFPQQQALGFPRTEEIDHGGDNGGESTSEDNSDILDLPPKKKYRRPASNSEIAEQLAKQICWGVERMASRTRVFDPFKVEKKYFVDQFEEIEAIQRDIFTKIGEIQARNSQRECGAAEDLEELDKLLVKGELKGITNQKEAKMWRWWYWYFSSCLRIILYGWRKVKRDRKANGAYVIHLIVNDLLRTEGVKALAVIAAFAGRASTSFRCCRSSRGTEQTYYLSKATDLSQQRLLEISGLVATSLRLEDKLKPPPGDYLIPTPVDWVSAATKLWYSSTSRE